jgi:hypothetical protein
MSGLVLRDSEWIVEPDTNLANLELTTVDLTDGSWSFVDVDSRISASSFSDGVSTITTNTITAGNINQITRNTDQNVPRWYKNLVDSDGVQLTTGDSFIFISTIQPLSSSNPSKYGFGAGISVNPIGTGSGTNEHCIQGQGQQQGWMFQHVCNQIALNVEKYTVSIYSAGASSINNATTSSIMTYINNFANTNGAGSISFSDIDNRLSKNNEVISNTTSSFFLQVGFGAKANSDSAANNSEYKQKIKFKIIKLSKT